MTNKKDIIQFGARLPTEIYEAIETYRKKAGLAFRTDALIDMVKMACAIQNIEIAKIKGSQLEKNVQQKPKLEEPKQLTQNQKIQSPKTDKIGCPDKDDWVTADICETCKVTQFNVWSNCYNERRKNPNNPIFKPTPKY